MCLLLFLLSQITYLCHSSSTNRSVSDELLSSISNSTAGKSNEIHKIAKLKTIIHEINQQTFNEQIDIIKNITNELLMIQSTIYFRQLPSIVKLIQSECKIKQKLSSQQIFTLFESINLNSPTLSRMTIKNEQNSALSLEQQTLIEASRVILHIWYRFQEINGFDWKRGYIVHGLSDHDIGIKCYPWLRLRETDDFIIRSGIWVYTFAVLFEHLIHHFNFASKQIQNEMIMKHTFIPWDMATIQYLKRKNYHFIWDIDPHQCSNSIQYFDFNRHPSETLSFRTKWILDLIPLLKHDKLTESQRDIVTTDIIIHSAFNNFKYGKKKQFEEVISLLSLDIVFDARMLMDLLLMDILSFEKIKDCEFKKQSIIILKELRNDWLFALTDIKLPNVMNYIDTKTNFKHNKFELFSLFSLMNIPINNQKELITETILLSPQQHILIVTSRILIHIWYQRKQTNHKELAVLARPWIYERNKHLVDYDSICCYSVALMYEFYVNEHYHNVSNKIKQEMIIKYNFIPWKMNIIQNFKRHYYVYIWNNFADGMSLFTAFYSELKGLNIHLFDVALNDPKFAAKWILDLFQLLNEETFGSKRRQIKWSETYRFILNTAFNNFVAGNDEEFRSLVCLLGDKFQSDPINLKIISKFGDRFCFNRERESVIKEFRLQSIAILYNISIHF